MEKPFNGLNEQSDEPSDILSGGLSDVLPNYLAGHNLDLSELKCLVVCKECSYLLDRVTISGKGSWNTLLAESLRDLKLVFGSCPRCKSERFKVVLDHAK